MPLHSADHWPKYNRGQQTRDLRELCLRVIELAGPGEGRLAIDLGAGLGRETAALLAAGWHVIAVDGSPGTDAAIQDTVGDHTPGTLDVRECRFEDLEQLPPCDLVYSGYSLPYLHSDAFGEFWRLITRSIVPGGWLAVNLFGENDSWAADPHMTFLGRNEMASLLDDFTLEHFHEEDSEGPAFSGPKHWHIFDVIGQKKKASAC